jgi:hypothetical protein
VYNCGEHVAKRKLAELAAANTLDFLKNDFGKAARANVSASEGVAEESDIRFFARLQIDTHNIEPVRWIAFYLAKKFAGNAGEITLLFWIHGGLCRLNSTRAASFHFNEAKRATIPTD